MKFHITFTGMSEGCLKVFYRTRLNFRPILVNREVSSTPVKPKTALKDNYNDGETHPKAETPPRNKKPMARLWLHGSTG